MPEAYAPCPCGSGKKFKWCCQPFYARIERAFEHQANGQHEAAVKAMAALTEEFPANAEVWGRYAELLWENERRDEAETAAAKAIEVQPSYAFAYYLRGMMRHEEGEVLGALTLYRQAADACDPEARNLLAEIQSSIGQCELMLNRPMAGKAAFDIAYRLAPGNESIQQYRQQYFGAQTPFPRLASKEFAFLPLDPSSSPDRKQAWTRALTADASGKLNEAVRAFQQLTVEDENDRAAWYNLGLVRAWLGDHPGSIEAFNNFVEREPDDARAGDAWAITELLKFGYGMDDRCDYLEHRAIYRFVNIEKAVAALQNERRIIGVQQAEQGVGGILLDRVMPAPHENIALYELPRVAGLFVIVGDRMLVMHIDETMLDKARQIVEEMMGDAVAAPDLDSRIPSFGQLMVYGLSVRLPQAVEQETAKRLIDQYYQQVFEEQWVQQPRKSLGLNTPLDAAGHAVLRKKLLGVIRFLEDMYLTFMPSFYDFDRLRHKLGLPTRRTPDASAAKVITAMSAANLAELNAEELSEADLNKAFQSAMRLEAGELAGRFARKLADAPASPGDRFAVFQHLLSLAANEQNWTEAQSLVDAGMKHDCEQNEGKRRNEYELKRAQLHLQAGEPEAAREVFARLIERLPSNLDVLGRATEAMLSAKLKPQAAVFAEQGLVQAKKSTDRGRVGYFEELLAAARR